MKSLLWLILFLASSTSWAWPPLTNTPTNTLTPFNSAPSSATPTPIIINPTRTATPLAVSVPGGVYLASPPPTSTPTITQTPTQTTTTLPSATATVTSTPTSTATPLVVQKGRVSVSGPITIYTTSTIVSVPTPFGWTTITTASESVSYEAVGSGGATFNFYAGFPNSTNTAGFDPLITVSSALVTQGAVLQDVPTTIYGVLPWTNFQLESVGGGLGTGTTAIVNIYWYQAP